MNLSDNFTLSELTRSDYAIRHGIDNTPNTSVLSNLRRLATEVLQPLRDHFGPIKVLSGYRCPQLNKAIGGSSTSDHMEGLAADIEAPSISNYELAKWIKDNLLFNQLILEFYIPGDKHSGWVHVSVGVKGQVLTAMKDNGSTVYRVGLVA